MPPKAQASVRRRVQLGAVDCLQRLAVAPRVQFRDFQGPAAERKTRSGLTQRPDAAATAAAAHRHPFCRRPSKPQPSRPASRPKSGATGSAAKGGKRGGMGQAAAAAAASPPAAAGADELRQRAELLERGLRAEEAARNYMQLERVRVMSRLKWEVLRCCLPMAVYRLCPSNAGTVLDALQPASSQSLPLAALLLQDKVQAFWDITKRELVDARAEARLKDRELEEEQVGAGGCCTSGAAPLLPPLSVPSA